jgi:hypothetical protein
MIVHWWRNEQGTVVYDFSYLRDAIAPDKLLVGKKVPWQPWSRDIPEIWLTRMRAPTKPSERDRVSIGLPMVLLLVFSLLAAIAALSGTGSHCFEYSMPIRLRGGKGIRTPGLLIANETLYQLSYTPT